MKTMTKKRSGCQWGLYVITDSQIAGRPHAEIAEAALCGGARVIQLRDKKATFEDLLLIGHQIRALTTQHGAMFIVNDNPYLAREVDADGVHVGQEDFPVEIVRDIMGPDRIVGLSTHTSMHVLQAAKLPVDYIGIGPVYATTSKVGPWPVVGTNFLKWAVETSRVPVVAIGGITAERVPEIAATGSPNFALIADLMKAQDIEAKTRELVEAFKVSSGSAK